MELSKIHVSTHKDGKSEKPCEFFKVNRYFSELTTDVEKARARYNLGIPDEFSLTWEAIAGKPNIDSLLNDLKSRIVSSYHLDTLAYDLQTIRSNVLELQNLTEGLSSSKLLEVEKLWSDVARNSRDILALQGGGYTSLGTRLTAVENKLAGLSDTVTISSIISRIAVLENNLSAAPDLSGITSAITTIQNDINNIKSLLATDEITSIYLNLQSLNVLESAGDLTIIVYAVHSKLANDENITAVCLCNTSNASVAYWDNSTKKVIIAGVGNAVLTFSYASKTTVLNIVVESESVDPLTETTYYIGYAPASALLNREIVGNNNFAVRNTSGTIAISGNDIFKYSGVDLGNGKLANGTNLFFCLPLGKSLQSWAEIFNSESEQLYYLTYSNGIDLGDVHYNVYYIGPISYNGLSYQFIIS